MRTIQRIARSLAAAWRAGADQPSSEEIDDMIRERLADLTVPEAIAMARVTALRDDEPELAAALQAVLLIHLTGGPLEAVAALVYPEPSREAVN